MLASDMSSSKSKYRIGCQVNALLEVGENMDELDIAIVRKTPAAAVFGVRCINVNGSWQR
jgi:hypothetical protein